ncbi:galactosyltransferase-related protein [Pontiellaceae bacterium B12219]|nr:galactosyltransferase-related protein [Pontiellaceae bacterium B12219]
MKTSAHLIIVTHTTRHLEAVLKGVSLLNPRPSTISVTCDVNKPEIEALIKASADEFKLQIYYTARTHHGIARPAQTRNNAVRTLMEHGHTSGQLIFIDGDMILVPSAIQQHLNLAEKYSVIVGERYNLLEEETPEFKQNLFKNIIPEIDIHSAEFQRLIKVDKKRKTQILLRRLGLTKPGKPKVIGCHFSIRFSDFIEINGFDERFTGYGGEDDDIGRRSHKKGLRYHTVAATIPAYHLYHPTRSYGKWKDNEGPAVYNDESWEVRCKPGLTSPTPQHEIQEKVLSPD